MHKVAVGCIDPLRRNARARARIVPVNTPIWCPVCMEMPLELTYATHQHLTCRYCDSQFCAICVDVAVVARSVHDYARQRFMALASPN